MTTINYVNFGADDFPIDLEQMEFLSASGQSENDYHNQFLFTLTIKMNICSENLKYCLKKS